MPHPYRDVALCNAMEALYSYVDMLYTGTTVDIHAAPRPSCTSCDRSRSPSMRDKDEVVSETNAVYRWLSLCIIHSTCTFAYAYVCPSLFIYIYIYARKEMPDDDDAHAYFNIYINTQNIYIYIHIHTYIYIYNFLAVEYFRNFKTFCYRGQLRRTLLLPRLLPRRLCISHIQHKCIYTHMYIYT